jgi:RHS repeat-associated protein
VAKLLNGEIVEKYLWQNKTTLLATYDGNGELKQRFEYTLGYAPTAFTQNGERYYLLTDQLGSPRIVTNSAGSVVKDIRYDSYGNVLEDSNPEFELPIEFAGGLYDNDTGLLRFGYRDFDPETGRWTARDPIGFAGGDTNLYGYVLGDPVNFVDPDGLKNRQLRERYPNSRKQRKAEKFKIIAQGWRDRLSNLQSQIKRNYEREKEISEALDHLEEVIEKTTHLDFPVECRYWYCPWDKNQSKQCGGPSMSPIRGPENNCRCLGGWVISK